MQHPNMSKMFVIKRDGRQEQVHFDKITARIMKLSYGLNPDFCDPVSVCTGCHHARFRHARISSTTNRRSMSGLVMSWRFIPIMRRSGCLLSRQVCVQTG